MRSVEVVAARRVFSEPLTAVLDLALLGPFVLLAFSTLAFAVGFGLSARFSAVATVICAAAIAIAAALIALSRARLRAAGLDVGDLRYLLGMVLLCSFGAIASASINRPDIDDSVYVPKALFYVQNPSAALDRRIDWIAGIDPQPQLGVAPYYELAQAVIAWLLEREYLDVYHVIAPAFVGFLICLAGLTLIRVFEPGRAAALASTLFLVFLLIALGETHRAYGNLSIARAFHGKFMFLSVGVPCWVYFSIRYFVTRDTLSWIALAAIGIGMAGATTTAMVLLPLLALVLFASYRISERESFASIACLKLSILYLSTLIPLAVMTAGYYAWASRHISAGGVLNVSFPQDFGGQAMLLINPSYPLGPVVFGVSLILVSYLSGWRRFFLAWVAIVVVCLLNPVVAGFLIRNITTENIYWRLFYLLPFPVVACVAFAAALTAGRVARALAVSAFAVFIPLAIWGPTSVLRPENRAALDFLGYKVLPGDLSVARAIVTHVPPGSMLAPINVSSNVVLLSSSHPQFHLRQDYLAFVLNGVGRSREVELRAGAHKYLQGKVADSQARESFAALLARTDRPRYVVVSLGAANHGEAARMLSAEGFESEYRIHDQYEVFRDTTTRGP